MRISERDSELETEGITPIIESELVSANNSQMLALSQPTNLERSPKLSSLVKSPSMNLIDDSAKHLFETMLDIGKNGNPTAAEINAVCRCADQIHRLLRLKFDVLRTFGD